MENYNEESFKWAVTRSLHPVDKKPQWITRDLRRQTHQHNWTDISFPTPLHQIRKFEKNNDVLVNVFRWDEVNELVHPIRIPKSKHTTPRAILILIDETKGHYVVVKSMQRLFRKQIGRSGKIFFCNNCLVDFSSDEDLQKHVVCCDNPLQGIISKPKRLETPPKPKSSLINRKALINMKCSQEESFKWTVTRFLNPVNNNPQCVTKLLKQQSNQYNWTDISFPTPLHQIRKFEKNNDVLVNVYEVGSNVNIQILRIPTGEYESRILLLFIAGRYAVVKTFSKLISNQTRGRKCKRFYCHNCLKNFVNENKFDVHTSLCGNKRC